MVSPDHISIPWELTNSSAPSQTYWIRHSGGGAQQSVLTRSLGVTGVDSSMRITLLEGVGLAREGRPAKPGTDCSWVWGSGRQWNSHNLMPTYIFPVLRKGTLDLQTKCTSCYQLVFVNLGKWFNSSEPQISFSSRRRAGVVNNRRFYLILLSPCKIH